MATFTNFIPAINQTDAARTSVVNFTIVDPGDTADINTLVVTINGTQAILNGLFINGYTGGLFPSSGRCVVGIYPKKPYFAAASTININIQIVDGALDSYGYSFYTTGYVPPPVPPEPYITRACDSTKPFFPPTDLGLVVAKDEGVGTEINLSWKQAYPYDPNDIIFYNIYCSNTRETVFDGYPDFLSEGTEATIWGLAPGDTHYFGVRVTEFNPKTFTNTGMIQAGADLFYYPEIVFTDGYINRTQTTITATSAEGFSNYGIIQIGSELISYATISGNNFINCLRGAGNTYQASHYSGSRLSLYFGQEDSNTTGGEATPTFQKPNYALTYVLNDGYGFDGYRDGYDGYAYSGGTIQFKQEVIDSNTTNGMQNDESGAFPRMDHCGTWRALSPASFMQGQCTPSYFGGAQIKFDSSGNRHLVKASNVYTQMSQREELLIETTGEPFVLMRRMWTGMRCHCFMNRREHADARCPQCFGTGFSSGYIQFFSPRRSDRRILVRIDPTTDDLLITETALVPQMEPAGWTLAFPEIKDRDILVRFIEDTLEEWRYEVLSVERNKVLFSQMGAQKLKLKRLPKTSIEYQFPIVRNCAPYPGAIQTSFTSTPGIKSHSHQIIVPQNTNKLIFSGATLESQGHNHIIYNGVVYSTLNHTHTL